MNRRFNLCTVVLVGLCALPVYGSLAQTPLAADQYEPNNTQSQSTVLGNLALNVPVVIHANLHGAEDQGDWYVVYGAAGSATGASFRLVVLLTGPSPDNAYELTLLSKPDGPGSQSQEVFSISGTNTAERVYPLNFACGVFNTGICPKILYLQVRRAAGNTANESYDLTLTLQGTVLPLLPPEIATVTPTSGPVGTTLTISGAHFAGTTAVKFQGVPSTFTITANSSISATVPSGAITGPISVSTPAGSASSISNFTVTSETAPPSSTGGASRTTAPSKNGGAPPVPSDKKQPPSLKPGTTQAPSSKIPTAKGPRMRKAPTPNCIGLGCGEDAPTCIGMGCGETEPRCIGLGCEKNGAVKPKTSRPTDAATLPPVKKPTIYGATPCCSITTIAGGLVTAKDSVTGKTFHFQVNNQAVAKTLRVGQNVYADFGTQQVSADGAAPCCAIVSAASGPTEAATIP